MIDNKENNQKNLPKISELQNDTRLSQSDFDILSIFPRDVFFSDYSAILQSKPTWKGYDRRFWVENCSTLIDLDYLSPVLSASTSTGYPESEMPTWDIIGWEEMDSENTISTHFYYVEKWKERISTIRIESQWNHMRFFRSSDGAEIAIMKFFTDSTTTNSGTSETRNASFCPFGITCPHIRESLSMENGELPWISYSKYPSIVIFGSSIRSSTDVYNTSIWASESAYLVIDSENATGRLIWNRSCDMSD